jgi:hypothetical protein
VTERTIDARCDAYVEDFCALDPLTPTSIGVAGHERHGVDVDLRSFHRAALDLGSLGLAPLRTALGRL